MEKPHLSKKPKVFYGYWIVAATFLCLLVVSGCGFFAFSLFVKPLEAALSWDRGEIMVAFTIFVLVRGVASVFAGRMIDRHEARKVITTGAIIVGFGFILLSQMSNLWHFYISYAVIGIGMAAMGHVPTSAIVSNWFEKRRGTVIGIMSAGIGAGGFTLAPLIGGYLIPNLGWKVSYLILAGFTWALIIPLGLFVIKTRPADIGLYPDGEQASKTVVATEVSPLTSKGVTLKMALATSSFWLIAIAFLTSGFSYVGIIQSQVPHLEDIGFPAVIAAGVLGIFGLFSLVSKFIFGWLCDRIPPKYACAIGFVLQMTSIIILMNIKPASPQALIWLYATTVGLAAGSWLPAMSMLVSTNFGLAAYGTIYGMLNLAMNIGDATGPLMAGYMYTNTGTYHQAFIIFLVLYVIAMPTILAVRHSKSLQNLKGE